MKSPTALRYCHLAKKARLLGYMEFAEECCAISRRLTPSKTKLEKFKAAAIYRLKSQFLTFLGY